MTSTETGRRLLGRTDLSIPPLVFGTMARRTARRQSPPEARQALFRYALEQGLNVFDTAPLYDFGATEQQLGEVLADFPEADALVFTKVGLNWRGDDHGPVHFKTADEQGGTRIVRRDSRPEAIRMDVEESLRRLGRERLDLVHVHFRDTDTPIPETMQALAELRRQGRIREIGVSNFTLEEVQTAARALGDVPLAAVQIRLNLLQRTPLAPSDIVSWCRENSVGVLAYSPLAEGRLARHSAGDRESRSLRKALTQLSSMAEADNTSMAALALGWLVNQPGVTGAIAGASTREQLAVMLDSASVDAETTNSLGHCFRHSRLVDPWEGPRWKRFLKGARRRLLS